MADSNSGSGIGLLSLLGVLFIGLKLGNVIEWPWIWVLAPFWIGAGLWVVVALGCVMVYLIAERKLSKKG